MRRASLSAVLASFLAAPCAGAVETRADVETDHVSAADDGGPRALGVLVNPFPMGIGWLGAEVDAACGQQVLFTIEGDTRAPGNRGFAGAAGLALFTQGVAFHGIYGRLSAEWAHETAFGESATAIGGAVRFGYEWTLLGGPTLRLGAGAGYARESVSGGGATIDLGGIRPRVDAAVGWVF
jgi:hypothetical protein